MTEIISDIRESAERRGITRLCHFTPSRNLGHIANDPRGILASRHLEDDEAALFNPTDKERLDGYRGHVCCSIQYPNAWYFRTARGNEKLFPDWVVMLINAKYLWRPGTKFCPRNAAAGFGRQVQEGFGAFEALFADRVQGSGNRVFERRQEHPAFLPTDQQAEVLIPDQVHKQDVLGIAVQDKAQAKREAARLTLLGHETPPILIAPQFFQPESLSNLLLAGRMPTERQHQTGATDAR